MFRGKNGLLPNVYCLVLESHLMKYCDFFCWSAFIPYTFVAGRTLVRFGIRDFLRIKIVVY
jgi:hypothetical protein